MKKFFAFIMVICLMTFALYVTAFAAETLADGTVLRVSALKKDGTTVVLENSQNLVEGWNKAMNFAKNTSEMKKKNYDRIVVDLFTDWTAVNGEFADDSDGFNEGAICIPAAARLTINLNDNTINRGLAEWVYDGEVIYINDDADVIINKGTITGGWSANGAGGIHVKDDVTLTLNDVHIVGNTADDDDGGGIALCDDATLIMNGGSFRNNRIIGITKGSCGGAIYMNDSTATFNNVEFKNNTTTWDDSYGTAIYAEDSQVTLNYCNFEANDLSDWNKSTFYSSVIYAHDSTFTVKDSTFSNHRIQSLFLLKGAELSVTTSKFTNNMYTDELIKATASNSSLYITDTIFSDNNAYAVSGNGTIRKDSFFRNCTFNNTNWNGQTFAVYDATITCYDCDFGDSAMNSNMKIVNSPVTKENAAIGVSGLLEDGKVSFTEYYKGAKEGWDAAMALAQTNAYDRIVVDLYADWNTDASVPYAVSVPENTKVTLNMNGYTIDADRGQDIINGEAVYIGKGADVIINEGTITGGFSCNGAGGIHIKDNANVVLNNVNLVKNATGFSANGGAIAMYDGSVLTMNGGTISNNSIYGPYAYGVLYVKEAIATLNNVIISDSYTYTANSEGLAIYADESTVTLNHCVVSGNATGKKGKYAETIVAAFDSKLIINNTEFTDNGAESSILDTDYSHLFYLEGSSLKMEGGKITGNKVDKLFYFENSKADIKGVTIADNASVVFEVVNASEKVTLTECTLGNNSPVKYDHDIKVNTKNTLVLADCTLGDTTFENKSMVMFSSTAVGSIFGEGSLTMIVAFVALIASVAAIIVNVSAKKKAAPATASADKETDDENE